MISGKPNKPEKLHCFQIKRKQVVFCANVWIENSGGIEKILKNMIR